LPAARPSGPFGLVAQHQQGRTKRRRFFLNTAGVAEDQVGIPHSADEVGMAARRQ
jgi:hypothetical protein